MNKNIFYLMLVAFLMPFAFGADCLDVNFEKITVEVYDSSTFVLKLESAAGTPMNPWDEYVGATIEYDNILFTNLGSDFVDLSVLATNVETFSFDATTPGTYLFNVSVINSSSGVCEKNLSIDVLPTVIEPVVSASITNFNNTMIVGLDEIFDIVLSNTGLGDGYNVSGTLSSGVGVLLNSTTISLDRISNMSINSLNYVLTPLVCGANSLDVSIPTYYDSNGALMTPIGTINENFNVIGSDVDVLENTFVATKIGTTIVSSVILNVSVENIGDIDSTATTVKFYDNTYSTLIGEVLVGNLSVGESKNISYTWNSPAAGTHTIKTLVESSNECPNLDQEDMPATITIPATSTGGGGSSGGGGGSSTKVADSSFDITYGTHQFEVNDIINFEAEGLIYIFKIIKVFSGGIQFEDPDNNVLGLLENGNYKYDLTKDVSVRITLDEIKSSNYVVLEFTKIDNTLSESTVDKTPVELDTEPTIDLIEENVTSDGNLSGLDLLDLDGNESADEEGFSLAGNVFSNNGNIWLSIFLFIILLAVVLGFVFKREDLSDEDEKEE